MIAIQHPPRFLRSLALFAAGILAGCGDGDGGGTEADRAGVAAECTQTTDCATYSLVDGGPKQLECLPDFKGGYCGIEGCTETAECPGGAICVKHTDNAKYCFRRCADKLECNANRTADNEANCSSSFDWALEADDDGSKACIPPSGS
jgi:hypothetical protein